MTVVLLQSALIESAKVYGFGAVVVIGVGWFLAYKVWPFYCKQVIANAEQRERVMNKFDERMAMQNTINTETVIALRELTTEIRTRRQR